MIANTTDFLCYLCENDSTCNVHDSVNGNWYFMYGIL